MAPDLPFAELGITSNFTFLKGASHPEEITVRASMLGLAGFSICDENTLAGSVRGHIAAKEAGIRYCVGCHLVFADGTPDLLIWPKDRAAYARLCRLLSTGRLRAPQSNNETRKNCHLILGDCLEWAEGSIIAVVPEGHSIAVLTETINTLSCLREPIRLILSMPYGASDKRRLFDLIKLSRQTKAKLMASNLPLYHARERRALQDTITAIREHVPLSQAGRLLAQNAERHLKTAHDMPYLTREVPEAFYETIKVMEAINFTLDELSYNYPQESAGKSATPQEELERLAHKGAKARYPEGVPDKVTRGLKHELALIHRLRYAPYFLTVYDIVRFARSQKILCQGRGSAANSVTCYCIGITEVNPDKIDVLFERFISEERKEPPDIDVDFEHERREEVIQYIYQKYGRHRAGLAATVITYRARSAIREVGKAFGLSEDCVGSLSATIWGQSSSTISKEEAAHIGYNPDDPMIKKVIEITEELIGFPRHLSQHVGGFVITDDRLDEVIPLQNATMEDRTIVEWDKDDLDHLNILKIDVLALGMLSCLRKAFSLLHQHYGLAYTLATQPAEDPRVYNMISRADTLGVFQIESRAQMSMLPRLKPRTFYDLVIEVAIVRPGPIQGDMVHPYLRRRQGLEKVVYPSKELEKVLSKTLGVPLFQEQAMKIAIVGAGFTPGEADRLRRAMATFRRVGTIGSFQKKMIDGMVAKGYEAGFAERCFKQIEGFGEYGFPESHAASFALLVYASCWFKCFYPDVFAAALLNSQPMGFYAPAQIVRDAREHGVEVHPVDVNYSIFDNQLEAMSSDWQISRYLHPKNHAMKDDIQTRYAMRLGFRQIKGLSAAVAEQLVAARGDGYRSLRDLWLKAGLSRAIIERLADADAFRSIGLDRRRALWDARHLDNNPKRKDGTQHLPLFDRADMPALQNEPDIKLPKMPLSEHVINDYRYLSLSLKGHPVSFVREQLRQVNVRPTVDLEVMQNNQFVNVAGLVLVRQRPGSAKGVIFATIEDETGIANVIVWPKTFQKYRPIVMGARFIKVSGKLQKADGVTHIIANHIEDWTDRLALLSEDIYQVDILDRADEVKRPVDDIATKIASRTKRGRRSVISPVAKDYIEAYINARVEGLAATSEEGIEATKNVLPKGRNFH